MRVLRRGMKGEDVKGWQTFLRGEDVYSGLIDGDFGQLTFDATRLWQRQQHLTDDGVVGLKTLGKAQGLGFNPGFSDDDESEQGPAWPPRPAFAPLDAAGRADLFGHFDFDPAPTPDNPEGIVIHGTWIADNIKTIVIPQLAKFPNTNGGKVRLHRLAVAPFVAWFDALEKAGLTDLLLSFNGSWVPRFIRGSTTNLSNHAYGSALDLNMAWNKLGVTPALKGRHGSVRELVPLANEFGLYWGGHFVGRPDGMHFELART